MKVEHVGTDISTILDFWVKHYELPPNTHLHRWEWYVNPKTGAMMFTLYIADGPDPLAR